MRYRESVLNNRINRKTIISYFLPDSQPYCNELKSLEQLFLKIKSTVFYCEIEGTGPPLILISGGPGTTHHYFHPSFSKAASFAKVIYYDQRGTGKTKFCENSSSFSLDEAITDLESIRKKLDLDKWFVLGHSFGGLIAQYYALRFQNCLSGLILVTPSLGLPDKDRLKGELNKYISSDEKKIMKEIMSKKNILSDRLLTYNKYKNGNWKRQFFYKPSESKLRKMHFEWGPKNGFIEKIEKSASLVNLKDKFKNKNFPTLIVEGKHDLTWGKEKLGLLRKNHQHAELSIMKHSAHYPFDDEPACFFSTIKHFIETNK